ncbi:MAG: hypothetical protein L6Q98_09610 [Anaerolineae bacterium]|nr:hypothetical protein [Anaerolineae bacterium]NUQ04040.1 hypothetical protein [Anaerolineae bacterium]
MNPVAWLIALPLASSPLIYLAGRLPLEPRRAARWQISWALSLAVLAGMWAVFAAAARDLAALSAAPVPALTVEVGALNLRIDGLSLFTAALVLGVSTLTLIFSGVGVSGRAGAEKYFAMILATGGAMIGMACAADLFNLWLWFEAMMIASLMLVAFAYDRPAALDAAIKYLVQNVVGSLLALMGIALVLGSAGSLRLDAVLNEAGSPALLTAGALFILGFGVKCALVPLHTWLPDVYTHAPIGTAALFSGAITVSGLIAMLRALAPLGGAAEVWGSLLLGFGALNIVAGNLLALRQKELRRLLAYSSISHIGFMLLALGVALYTREPAAAQAGLFHLLNHSVMKALAFLTIGGGLYSLGMDADRPMPFRQLRGLGRSSPLAALALTLAILSLAGLPPLAGFISKWQVFQAGMASGSPAAGALTLFAALNTLLSLAYYLPVVMLLFADAPAEAGAPRRPLPWRMQIPLILLLGFVLLFGILPDLARLLTDPASAALQGGFGGLDRLISLNGDSLWRLFF